MRAPHEIITAELEPRLGGSASNAAIDIIGVLNAAGFVVVAKADLRQVLLTEDANPHEIGPASIRLHEVSRR